jgi:cbb3-type cytochrome oxidase subunit 3
MNLIKEYLGSIAGIEIFAIISMLIFILTFVLMILHAFSFREEQIRDFSQLPLDENEAIQEDE